jgi:hypothetical protein
MCLEIAILCKFVGKLNLALVEKEQHAWADHIAEKYGAL